MAKLFLFKYRKEGWGGKSLQVIVGRRFYRRNSKAQSLLEYTALLGIVTIVFFAMFNSIKRGIQSVIKITADQVGNQQQSDQIVSRQDSGYLVESYSATRANNRKQAREVSGERQYIYDEGVFIHSNSFYNLGYSPRANN